MTYTAPKSIRVRLHAINESKFNLRLHARKKKMQKKLLSISYILMHFIKKIITPKLTSEHPIQIPDQ